jgi:hypothetical protein
LGAIGFVFQLLRGVSLKNEALAGPKRVGNLPMYFFSQIWRQMAEYGNDHIPSVRLKLIGG